MRDLILQFWPVVLGWLAAVNVLDFILMGVDKRRAKRDAWRY